MILSSEIHRARPATTANRTFPNRIRSLLEGLPAATVRSGATDLKTKVRRHLESYAECLSEVVQIEVDGDAVIVSGTVESDDDRQLVVQIISLIREVLSIRDQLEVAYPGRGRPIVEDPQALWIAILGCWGQDPTKSVLQRRTRG